jgi:hypothetical protein
MNYPQYCEGFGNTIVGEGKAKGKSQKAKGKSFIKF